MKTVIEMAREAGLHRQQHNLMSNPVQHRFSYDGYEENLERFAEIVRADERSACLDVIESHRIPVGNSAAGEMACEWTYEALKEIKAAIQARRNT